MSIHRIAIALTGVLCWFSLATPTFARAGDANTSNPNPNATAAEARAAAAGPQAAAKMSTNLIARDVIFGNPERAQVRLSHDGKHISWLSPVNGVMNIWVAPANDLNASKAVTK